MVYPTMVMNLIPVGLLGVMLAALLSALTSTLSAILNSTSTLITMDFYAKFCPKASSKKLVLVGRITSLIIIVLAALWAPQIGKFGSLLKYYQEMLSYLAPPIVATFVLGIFCKRVNGLGAFLGLLFGLGIAVVGYLFKTELFGNLHFLLIVPILFVCSGSITYMCSYLFPAPPQEKLKDTVFVWTNMREEIQRAYRLPWYQNYFNYAIMLVLACGLVYLIFK